MAVVAIIPARGGSKGIPRKNLRLVGAHSLLARAVGACRNAGGIDTVLVSTDDIEIQREAELLGASAPFLRPAELAADKTGTLPVLQHAIKVLETSGVDVTIVVLVEPTSPFRTAKHVDEALERFHQGDCRSVVTVTALERKPENIFIKSMHLSRYIKLPREKFARRQDMAHLCRINSAVYVVGRDDLMSGDLMPAPIGWVEMNALSSINIDTPLDLALANYLVEHEPMSVEV